ncbi:activating signal cointegrator 1 complex subunit 1 [Neocloeon triangulifer]|uniref:activating signal cointegrator 1 complex subunit 1 n=1 Tax=Neocloeon triangulifer TaxID=2078957 RepID=UPI00286EC0F4|nr:activating signal cointegrator 1 complex subunit 1 [Neocloeon triangulifer]
MTESAGKNSQACFRIGTNSGPEANKEPSASDSKVQYEPEWLEEEEELENIYHIEEDTSGKFKYKCSLDLPCKLFGFIIGQRGSVKIGIEQSTKTKIFVPGKSNDVNGTIVIGGYAVDDVQSACRKIFHIVETNRSAVRPTHFVGIAIASPEIKKSFEIFKKISPLKTNLMQATEKLHITLGMLVLLNVSERSAAASIIEDFVHENLRPNYPKFKLQIKGLEIMGDDPTSTRVLYGDVVKDEVHDEFQQHCQELLSRLDNAGFLRRDKFQANRDDVKLHMTVANATFAERQFPQQNSAEAPDKLNFAFDVSDVLSKLGNFEFGECVIESLDICETGTSTEEDGYMKVSQHFLDPKKASPDTYICK